MPEHDETDAPDDECSAIGCRKSATQGVASGVVIYPYCDEHAMALLERRPKVERWGVEDKTVDSDTK